MRERIDTIRAFSVTDMILMTRGRRRTEMRELFIAHKKSGRHVDDHAMAFAYRARYAAAPRLACESGRWRFELLSPPRKRLHRVGRDFCTKDMLMSARRTCAYALARSLSTSRARCRRSFRRHIFESQSIQRAPATRKSDIIGREAPMRLDDDTHRQAATAK